MIPFMFGVISIAVLLVVVVMDVILAFGRPHAPTTRESASWLITYVVLALLFGLSLWWVSGIDVASQFVTGWMTEYSLSLDNLFIFLVIMASFAVPKKSSQAILLIGILLALVFRSIFIVVGVQLVQDFSWVFYIFAAIMLYAAANQTLTAEKKEEHSENRLIRWLRKRVPITVRFHDAHLRMTINGRKLFTPALLVFITLGTTDAVLSLDSIPAVFGITQNPFLIITANIFALMGLRQVYFLLGTMLRRLTYLRFGIAAVFVFIGVKLAFIALRDNHVPFINGGHAVLWIPDLSTSLTFAFVILAMSIAVIASLFKLRRTRTTP